MYIQLHELHWTNNTFHIAITFDTNTRFEISFNNLYDKTLEANLEWYFEDYIREPYIAQAKVQKCRNSVFDYGKDLFNQLFADRKIYSYYKKGIDEKGFENLTIEIIGDSPDFQAIHWEMLHDPDFDRPLSVLGTVFYRKNLRPNALDAKVKSFPYLNVLIVTARPHEENDVNYRTIQRPLMNLIRKSRLRVMLHILRPGMYRSLVNHLDEVGAGYYHIIHFDLHGGVLDYEILKHLREHNIVSFDTVEFQSRWGLYDLQKFEGKKAFLFFESEKKGVAVPIEATELANQLQKYRIPECILNACQSAKQKNITHETSLGKILSESGMQLVLAMCYSVSVTAAEILMQTVYEQLLQGRTVEQAITFGRQALYYDKNRNAMLGQTIELEDWVLPVVYKNRDVIFNIRDFKDNQEEEAFYLKKERRYKARKLQYGFHGRDLDILKIEKLLLHYNHLLLQGMGGVGKTTLLEYLAGWWSETNFVHATFYLPYDQKAWTVEQIWFEIARKILPEVELNQFYSKSQIVQKQRLLEILNAERYCLMLDNFESVTGEKLAIQNTLSEPKKVALKDFLSEISRSFVIYSSRSNEEWLQDETFQDNIYILKGFDEETTYQFAKEILKRIHLPFEVIIKDIYLGRLLELLAGYPLAIQAVLPNLNTKLSEEILEDLKAGDVHLDEENKKEKTQSILKCIEYSHSNLSEDVQKLIACLAPFQSAINFEYIKYYLDELKNFDTFKEYPFEKINMVVKESIQNGFMQEATKDIPDQIMTLQPVFTYFLKNKLNETTDNIFSENLDTAFINYYNNLGKRLVLLSTSPKEEDKHLFRVLTKFEYENLFTTLEKSLNRQESILYPFVVLDTFLELNQNHQDRLIIAEFVSKKFKEYPPDKLKSKLGLEFISIIDRIGSSYLSMSQFEKAKTIYLKVLELSNDYVLSATTS